MKKPQNVAMPPLLAEQLRDMGVRIARMRKARSLLQVEVAIRANISRETASRIENGDASVAIGQVVRYFNVIAPGTALTKLDMPDSALAMLESSEQRKRARKPSRKALEKYEF